MEGLVKEHYKGFYRGRKVLVTGSTGFKGSWLCLWLSRLGAEVTGLSLPPARDAGLTRDTRIRQIHGDITNAGTVRDAVRDSGAEIVFHLAAQPIVLESYRSPALTFLTNVQGTVHVLDALRDAPGVRAIVVITSDKCYANPGVPMRLRETDPLGGADPYSASKACAELAAASYRDSFFAPAGVGLATARAGNVIGGGDWAADRIVPDCIRHLQAKTPILLRRPNAIRPWQHVLEPLRGYLMLGARLAQEPQRFASAWNFGPAESAWWPVRDVAQAVCRHWGSGEITEASDAPAVHEAELLAVDSTRSRAALGWTPILDIEASIRETVTWYKRVHGGADGVATSLEQIGHFGGDDL